MTVAVNWGSNNAGMGKGRISLPFLVRSVPWSSPHGLIVRWFKLWKLVIGFKRTCQCLSDTETTQKNRIESGFSDLGKYRIRSTWNRAAAQQSIVLMQNYPVFGKTFSKCVVNYSSDFNNIHSNTKNFSRHCFIDSIKVTIQMAYKQPCKNKSI